MDRTQCCRRAVTVPFDVVTRRDAGWSSGSSLSSRPSSIDGSASQGGWAAAMNHFSNAGDWVRKVRTLYTELHSERRPQAVTPTTIVRSS